MKKAILGAAALGCCVALTSSALSASCNIPKSCLSLTFTKTSQTCQGEPRRQYNAAAIRSASCPTSFTLTYDDYEGSESLQVTQRGSKFNTCGPAKITSLKGDCPDKPVRKGKREAEDELPGGWLIGKTLVYSYTECYAGGSCHKRPAATIKIYSDMLNRQVLSPGANGCHSTLTYEATKRSFVLDDKGSCPNSFRSHLVLEFRFGDRNSCSVKMSYNSSNVDSMGKPFSNKTWSTGASCMIQ